MTKEELKKLEKILLEEGYKITKKRNKIEIEHKKCGNKKEYKKDQLEEIKTCNCVSTNKLIKKITETQGECNYNIELFSYISLDTKIKDLETGKEKEVFYVLQELNHTDIEDKKLKKLEIKAKEKTEKVHTEYELLNVRITPKKAIRIRVRHNCGNIRYFSCRAYLDNDWLPNCICKGNPNYKQEQKNKKYEEKLSRIHYGDFKLEGDYKSAKEPTTYRHLFCERTFKRTPNNFDIQPKCPYCDK